MKSIKKHMPKQTRSLTRNERSEVAMAGASSAEAIKASGWLDVLKKAAGGAMQGVMG